MDESSGNVSLSMGLGEKRALYTPSIAHAGAKLSK